MSEMNDLNEQIDNLAKAKATADKNASGLDASLSEANARIAALEASLRELTDKYNKLVKDNNATVGRLEEAEAREANLAKQKKVLSAQIDDLKGQLEDESAQKNQLINQLRAATADLNAARDDLEISNAEKNDLARNLSNAQNEVQSWKSRLESEALPKIDGRDLFVCRKVIFVNCAFSNLFWPFACFGIVELGQESIIQSKYCVPLIVVLLANP